MSITNFKKGVKNLAKELKQKKVTIDGKRHSIYYRTEREFQEKYRQLLTKKEEKETLPTFKVVAEKWQEDHESEIEHYTNECYKAPLKDCIAWFGSYQIDCIHPKDIQQHLNEMQMQGYARQTINLRKIVLTQVFKYAQFNELVNSNPAEPCKVPKAPKKVRALPDVSLAHTIIEHALDDWFSFYLLMCLATGCRKSEVLALTKSDFDFKKSEINIAKSVIFEHNNPTIREYGKSYYASRRVPILPQFCDIMKAYLKQCDEQIFNCTSGSFNWNLRRYRTLHNVDFECHQLRHLYATIMCEIDDISLKDVQKIMGHSKAETTLNIYAHSRDVIDIEKAREQFDKALKLS